MLVLFSILRTNMEGLYHYPSPLKALGFTAVLENMRVVFVLHAWGKLIHHTATSEGLAWTQEASYCQNAAERAQWEGEGASLGRVVWGKQRNVSSKVLLGHRHWAGSGYRPGYASAEIWTLQRLKGMWGSQCHIYDKQDSFWVCSSFLLRDSLSNDGCWCHSVSRDVLCQITVCL